MSKEKECTVRIEVVMSAVGQKLRVEVDYYSKVTKIELDAWRDEGLVLCDSEGNELKVGDCGKATTFFIVWRCSEQFPFLQSLFHTNPHIFPAISAELEKFKDACAEEDVKKLAKYACEKIKEIAKI